LTYFFINSKPSNDATKLREENEKLKQEITKLFGELRGHGTSPADKEFTIRQAQMQFQLTEYDSDLQRKQALHSKMLDNLSHTHMTSMGNMEQLLIIESRIDCLEREKKDLQRDMTEQKSLEAQLGDLKRREKEHIRMMTLKAESKKQCEKLKKKIIQIKSDRVKLIEQMKSDNDSFKRYKSEKEKEVNR